jgi:uncharacterized protein with LGFP repeats
VAAAFDAIARELEVTTGSCLGMPITDEAALPDGRISRFERGNISFRHNRARAYCTPSE